MSWWKKVLKVVVPIGSAAATVFVKNPKKKKVVEQIQDIAQKVDIKSKL